MQQCQAIVIFVAILHVANSATLFAAKSFAHQWLTGHPAPQQDELGELKKENPEAYAIVEALLTKRSLGLLDSKHPSASFAAHPSDSDAVSSGPEVFTNMMTPAERSKTSSTTADLAYPEAPAVSTHHDWLNWKPQTSALDDDAMVQNVLGVAASLTAKGAVTTKNSQDGSSHLSAYEGAFTSNAATDAPPRLAVKKTSAPVVAPENAYLASAGLETPAPKAIASAIQGNSYLRGIDFSAELGQKSTAQESPAEDSGGNALASFSFDDDDKPKAHKQPQERSEASAVAQTTQQKATSKQPKPALNALTSWLSGGSPAVQKVATPTPQAVAKNPYAVQW